MSKNLEDKDHPAPATRIGTRFLNMLPSPVSFLHQNQSFSQRMLPVSSERTLGEKFADAVTARIGSWAFISTQSGFLAAWVAANVLSFVPHWDPSPFIMLNLMLSFQAAYAGPILMIAHKRQQKIDRFEALKDCLTNIKASDEITQALKKIAGLKAQSNQLQALLDGRPIPDLVLPDEPDPNPLPTDIESLLGNRKWTLGERFADAVTDGIGSWKFIIGQSLILTAWIIANVTHVVPHWDNSPFIMLNLMLSFQAAYTTPLVMISQNRQKQIDDEIAKIDHKINIEAEEKLANLNLQIDELTTQNAGLMVRLAAKLGHPFPSKDLAGPKAPTLH